jgi:hypothetical protein
MIDARVIEEYIDATARLLELEILPAHRPEVIRNFKLLMSQARRVLEFPLDERTEMAPVFLCGE